MRDPADSRSHAGSFPPIRHAGLTCWPLQVRCQTSLQQYGSADTTVTRRFNHFVWLHAMLTEQYPGYFIPALPDKSGLGPVLNRFQEEFVEHRRLALHKFLLRLTQHPVICTSKPLQVPAHF